MIAFVVSVNGQRVCTIGIGDSGVLGAHVSWSGLPGEPADLRLSFGGLDTRTDQHIRWPDPPEIKVGDAVTIQVIETDLVDPPTDRKTPAELVEEEKAFLADMEASREERGHS
ncbi:MAG: nucleolar 14 family protein [Gemmataceae bacterium]|nr:nucleolar 14 family protein [Gemmataceae bacterium]